ncbi:AAA family ATPase [Yersinia enterocolitica]|uniref:AAA family ATPase n=1 Tax=Yersinia enterocolitica TaxID=630 RepID=UPI003F436778
MNIDNFVIHKLNGCNTYNIDIRDNKFILIGENGTGKSTVLAIMYYFLSRKWSKLSEYDFDSIELVINGDKIIISRFEIIQGIEKNSRRSSGNRTMNKLREYVASQLRSNVSIVNDSRTFSKSEINKQIFEIRRDFKSDNGISPPLNVVKDIVSEFLVFDSEENYFKDKDGYNNFELVKSFMELNINIPILYLPTYRRIEQDIEQVFSHSLELSEYIEENIGSTNELVNFGMKDVEGLVNLAMQELSSDFRIKLKDLIASSLQDILGHKYDIKRAEHSFSDIGEKELEEILARVDSETLSTQVKEEIRKNTRNYGRGGKASDSESDKVIFYFIIKLIELHREQSKNEEHIVNFISLCNKYLVNKEIFFDRIKFEVYVILKGSQYSNIVKRIKWDTLSSGEKQIISLFSKIFLGKNSDFIMIIDEPELSLSLAWQSLFLEDIVNTSFCQGMFAVTHSPFIYHNSLKDYAQSVSSIMEVE